MDLLVGKKLQKAPEVTRNEKMYGIIPSDETKLIAAFPAMAMSVYDGQNSKNKK